MIQKCALCDLDVGHNQIVEESLFFCCHGCHAVYKILESKQVLESFRTHPIFEQAVKSGLISNPDLIEQIRAKNRSNPAEEQEKLHLEVEEMWCPSCAEVIKLILMQEKGISHCLVDYSTDLASIQFCPRYISKERIFKIISSLGYSPRKLEDLNDRSISFSLYMRFIVACFCALNVMMFSYPIYASYFNEEELGYAHLFSWLSFAATIPVATYSAWPIYRRFLNSLRVGLLGMEALIVIGTLSALALSTYELIMGSNRVYFDTLTVIVTLVLLGKMIESKAKISSKNTLYRLSQSLPKRGRKVVSAQQSQFVPLKEIQVGDSLIALTGEKVVLDGIVEEGEATVDESHLTGEAWPVSKKKGSLVLSGSILLQGTLQYRVAKNLKETALHKIIEMVEMEIDHKTPYVRKADVIARWFVPLVLVLSLLSLAYSGEDRFATAMSILLISCPCAIGIAAPLAEAYTIGKLASIGAIVRNRGVLSILGKETVMIFDKTGTATTGHFQVTSGLNDLSQQHKSILKGLVNCSSHPVSVAIAQAISEPPVKVEYAQEVIGKGIKGSVDGKVYLLGSSSFLKIASQDEGTTVYFAENGKCIGSIGLADQLRPELPALIESWHHCKSILLSGDGQKAVEEMAKQGGFKEWKGECSPFEKKEFIEKLRKDGEVVCMIGDGINDAPALTAAHIGISVISAKDISVQVSDLILSTESLAGLSEVCHVARKGRKVVRQNLFWAFFYNVVGIGLAAAGLLSPIFAAFAMGTSSFIVLFNARRLK